MIRRVLPASARRLRPPRKKWTWRSPPRWHCESCAAIYRPRTLLRNGSSASSTRMVHHSKAPPPPLDGLLGGGAAGGGTCAGLAFTVMLTSSTEVWPVSSLTASWKRSTSLVPVGLGAVNCAVAVLPPDKATAVPCICVQE